MVKTFRSKTATAERHNANQEHFIRQGFVNIIFDVIYDERFSVCDTETIHLLYSHASSIHIKIDDFQSWKNFLTKRNLKTLCDLIYHIIYKRLWFAWERAAIQNFNNWIEIRRYLKTMQPNNKAKRTYCAAFFPLSRIF